MNIGDLKEIIKALPDSAPIEVRLYNHRYDDESVGRIEGSVKAQGELVYSDVLGGGRLIVIAEE